MMRKLISAILAVASIVCTTSSLAATSDGTLDSKSRNNIAALEDVETNVTSMPAFRGGDKIIFDVSGLTNENFLTVISYKYNKPEDLSDATIQYIDQYKVNQDTQTVEYTVRDTTEEGIYKISLNGNDEGEIVDFYYKVGNVKVTVMPGENTSYVRRVDYQSNGTTLYAVGFVAKAVVGSNDVSLTDLGVTALGFTFKANGKEITRTLTQEQFDAISDAQKYYETDGSVAFVYGVTIYGIDSVASADAIEAEAYSNDN